MHFTRVPFPCQSRIHILYMADPCIVHKEHYMQGGLITWQNDDEGEDHDDVEMLDDEQCVILKVVQ